jgi:hypothetical protein
LLLLPPALLLIAFVGLSAATRGFILLDTYDVLFGSAAASRCLQGRVLSGCNVGQFALLQYLPAFAFHQLGISLTSAANDLVALNGLAALGVLVVVTTTVTRAAGQAAAAIAAAFVLASPLLWYAHGGYGEPLGAVAITGFSAALLAGASPWVTGGALFLAGISKETAVPFLLAIAAVVWLMRGGTRPLRRAEVVAIAASAAAAVGVNMAFNLFRYGTVYNAHYADSAYEARLHELPANVAALLASPTGGVIWMWPSVVAVVGAATFAGLRRRGLREPGLAVGLLSCVLVLGISQWYAPLGGTTWGPRLLIPWLPTLLMLGVVAYPGTTRAAVARCVGGSRLTVALVSAAVIVTGLPHIVVTVDSAEHRHAPPGLTADLRELVVRPFAADATCPQQPRIEENRSYYLTCQEHRTWHKGIAPLEAYSRLTNPLVAGFAILWSAAIVGLIGYARARARRQAPTLA